MFSKGPVIIWDGLISCMHHAAGCVSHMGIDLSSPGRGVRARAHELDRLRRSRGSLKKLIQEKKKKHVCDNKEDPEGFLMLCVVVVIKRGLN